MVPEFGKVMRKIRVDQELTLADLGKLVGKSAVFLSAIETGKKPVPAGFLEELIQKLQLDESKASDLRVAAAKTRKVVINLEGRDDLSRKLAVAFARRMDEPMHSMEIQELLSLLDKKGT